MSSDRRKLYGVGRSRAIGKRVLTKRRTNRLKVMPVPPFIVAETERTTEETIESRALRGAPKRVRKRMLA